MKDSDIQILRTTKCRKSDVIINFLKNENIPHTVLYLDRNEEAAQLAKKHNILASPGILVNGQSLNPYHLIERCQVKDPEKTKEELQQLLQEDKN